LVEIILFILLVASLAGVIFLFLDNTQKTIELSRSQVMEQMLRVSLDEHKFYYDQHKGRLSGEVSELKEDRRELREEIAETNTKHDYLLGKHEAQKAAHAIQVAAYKENEEGSRGRAVDLINENAELKGLRKADKGIHDGQIYILTGHLKTWEERDEILRKMYIGLVDKVIMGQSGTIKHAPLSPLSAVPPPMGSKKPH